MFLKIRIINKMLKMTMEDFTFVLNPICMYFYVLI